MQRNSWIELQRENMKFSVGHFTIFSENERENLHGHNYSVYIGLLATFAENGLAFDYRTYKQKAMDLCRELNQRFLIPAKSPYLQIEDTGKYYEVHFADEVIPFLKRDVLIVPLSNITVEELSCWFVERLTQDRRALREHKISEIVVKVFSAPGQSGSCSWQQEN